jgi:uncharacterized membrane protein (UPF0127 family)
MNALPSFGAARNVERGTVLATRLETADGLWAKFMGLMGRASLEPDAGLWLPDSNGIHMMFMRFPIDAVFVGRPDSATAVGAARPVISVHRGLRAWIGLVPLVRGAHGVLELPVGTIARTGTVPGDHIVFEPQRRPAASAGTDLTARGVARSSG